MAAKHKANPNLRVGLTTVVVAIGVIATMTDSFLGPGAARPLIAAGAGIAAYAFARKTRAGQALAANLRI